MFTPPPPSLYKHSIQAAGGETANILFSQAEDEFPPTVGLPAMLLSKRRSDNCYYFDYCEIYCYRYNRLLTIYWFNHDGFYCKNK